MSKAEEFTSRIDGCAASGRFGGWLSPGERIIAGRWRDFVCPIGYSGIPCARFAEASCGVGNPIQPGQGNKQLSERNWGPMGPGALALTRSYNSHYRT